MCNKSTETEYGSQVGGRAPGNSAVFSGEHARRLSVSPGAVVDGVSPGLSPIQRLKRNFNECDLSLELNFSKPGSKPVRWVGLRKIRELLNPEHSWFDDKQGKILDWEAYQCEEFPKPIFAYPRLSLITPGSNPYKLSNKASQSAMKSLKALKVVAETRKLESIKVLDSVFTFPSEITSWLNTRNHGFTRDSEAMAWKLWREFWSKPICEGRGKNRKIISTSLEEFLLEGKKGKLGCHVNLHIWSTKVPAVPHWHFHVLALNQSYNNGNFTEIGHYLEGERLKELKRLWKARLLNFAGKNGIDVASLKDKKGENGEALPVVHCRFVDWLDMPRIVHKFQYVNRSPIEDYALYSNKNPDCADPPAWLAGYTNRARCYGWFREYGQIIGKLEYEELKEEKAKTCPLCSGKLAKVGTIHQSDIEAMLHNGTPMLSLEWHLGKLRNVPLSKTDIDFLLNQHLQKTQGPLTTSQS